MTLQQKKIAQIVVLILVVLLLIRFFPLAFRMVEGAAMGIRQFWWVVLILIFGAWVFWIARKK